MKPLEDAKGRMIMRDNFLIEGINCKVDTFGAECIEVNRFYGKKMRDAITKCGQRQKL